MDDYDLELTKQMAIKQDRDILTELKYLSPPPPTGLLTANGLHDDFKSMTMGEAAAFLKAQG